jgi:hypothetical protein
MLFKYHPPLFKEFSNFQRHCSFNHTIRFEVIVHGKMIHIPTGSALIHIFLI